MDAGRVGQDLFGGVSRIHAYVDVVLLQQTVWETVIIDEETA